MTTPEDALSNAERLGVFPKTFAFGPRCKSCERELSLDDVSVEFFSKGEAPCPGCRTPIDWWDMIRSSIEDVDMFYGPLALVGAQWTIASVEMQPDKDYQLDLTQHGVPEDARVLYINYTPQGGGLFPIERHGNTPFRHLFPKRIVLHPVRFGEEPAGKTRVAILTCWVQPQPAEFSQLTEALDAHVRRQPADAVIPASTAAEVALTTLLADVLERWVSRSRVRAFLPDLGYGHSLNVLLPSLVGRAGGPGLPENISGQLNRLRALRNEAAHRGQLAVTPTVGEMAQLLTASVLFLRYVTLIRPTLLD